MKTGDKRLDALIAECGDDFDAFADLTGAYPVNADQSDVKVMIDDRGERHDWSNFRWIVDPVTRRWFCWGRRDGIMEFVGETEAAFMTRKLRR